LRIVILKAGEAVPDVAQRRGDFAALIRKASGTPALFSEEQWREHDLRTGAPLPALEGRDASVDAFIITGSAASVTERAPWMLRAEEYIRAIVAARVPLLGICFGHQLVAQALGGLVAKNPRGREIGTVRARQIGMDDDALLSSVPPEFDVNASHIDSVARLPPGARILAATALDPASVFAVGDTTRCVQFHPEFDGDVVRSYIAARASVIAAEGKDPAALASAAVDAPHGARFLYNFVRRFPRAASGLGSSSAMRR
jgi:GMP synthase (glutamine-hydrolysing)